MLVCLLVVVANLVAALAVQTSSNSDFYYKNWCNVSGLPYQYLYDQKCAKVFPSSFDRDWVCPVPTYSAADVDALLKNSYAPDQSMSTVTVDTQTLDGIVTNGASLCVILTKRVQSATGENGVQLYNKYYCAGEHSATDVYETWSSAKIFTMANSAGHLRSNESTCALETFGMDSSTTGKHGTTLLGDLATVVCSYDHTAGYTSNSLSSYFHDMVMTCSMLKILCFPLYWFFLLW
jgi:hypothetical protein